MNRKIAFAFIMFFVCLNLSYGQDSHFSNLIQTRSFINPASCGNFIEDYQISGAYRNQYATVPVGYNTFYLSGETKFKQFNVGSILLNDKAGDASWQTTQLVIPISKNLKIIDKVFDVSFGAMPGFHFNSFSPDKLLFNTQFNGDVFSISNPNGENFITNKSSFFSCAFGFIAKYKVAPKLMLNAGCSYKLNTSFLKTYNKGNNQYSNKNNFYLNLQQVFSDVAYLNYEVNYSQQKKYKQILLNSILTKKTIGNKKVSAIKIGLGLRMHDAAILYTGFVANNFDINLCYDINYSGFSKATNSFGAIEIAVVYKMYKSRIIKSNLQSCPVYM